tara:strand:- start:405 stop:881 length:477 start_codon:yes stop_codon:yes gene_type:complete
MIQRIQTIYLFLAAVCIALQLFFPTFIIYKEIEGETTETMFYLSQGLFEKIIFVLLALFPIAGLMLYKNRGKQIMVTRLGLISYILVAIGFILIAFLAKDYLIESSIVDLEILETGAIYKIGNGLGYYLMFVAVPFMLLAIRGIRADEKLVKSLDRLR